MTDDDDENDPRKYKQLAAAIRTQIADGTLQRGEQVPTITNLAAEKGWSRQTCARALQRLEGEGLLKRYDGLGYFVTGSATRPTKP